MKVGIVACAVILVSVVMAPPAQARSKFKECAAQWNAAKAANQTEGRTYREFQKACLSKSCLRQDRRHHADVKSAAVTDKPAKAKSAKARKCRVAARRQQRAAAPVAGNGRPTRRREKSLME